MKQLESAPRRLHVENIGEATLIRPEGACDTECARALNGLISHMEEASTRNIILDASRIRYIDTPGFRWIIDQFRKLQELGGSLVVIGLKGPAERAFKLLQLDKFIPSAQTVEGALARLKRSEKGRA